jgi:ABC-type transporter Mla subunit MlaD
MGQDQGQERAQLADDQSKSAAELRAEIEDVREDLGETAAALAAKTDVKARAHERADELKRSAAAKKDDLLAKAKQAVPGADSATPGDAPAGRPGGAGAAVTKLRATARENPVPAATLVALAGGFLLGRLTRPGPE